MAKLRERITFKQTKEAAKFVEGNMINPERLPDLIKIIAVNDDGSEIDDVEELTEEEILDIVAAYVTKKNNTMKSFMKKLGG